MTSVKALFIFIFLLISSFAYGQLKSADSLLRNNSIFLIKQTYEAKVNGNSQLFNGIEYIDPFLKKSLSGSPYFLTEEWQKGFVFYGDQLYENASLRYNLFQDKLLIEHPQSHVTIELITKKIKYFGMEGHIFIWLSGEDDLKEGFHDLLYEGKTMVYARRYKAMNEMIDQKVMITKLSDKTKLLLFKDETYFAISNKSSALNAFGDKKTEVKKFLSQEKINFRTDPERALVAMAKFYDEERK